MVTWLHLSDFQVQAKSSPEPLLGLKEDLKQVLTSAKLNLDFVCITGDLAFSGESDEYDRVSPHIDDLLDVTGLSRDRLFMIPGNHDVEQSVFDQFYRGEPGTAKAGRADILPWTVGLDAYYEFAGHYLVSIPKPDEYRFKVRHLNLSGIRIALLALNTAWLGDFRSYLPPELLDSIRPHF